VKTHALKEIARKSSGLVALLALAAVAPGACATEPGIVPITGYSGGTGGTGAGGSGFGGTAGTGSGGTSNNDASSTGDTGPGGCPGPKALDPMALPACPDDVRCVDIPSSSSPEGGTSEGGTSQRVCVNSRCVPVAAIPDPSTVSQLPNCPMADTKCVPDIFVEVNGRFALKTCRSLMDAEGRCVPVSLPAVRAQVGRLPQGGCAADERCAPCYDPISGEKTGACEAGCGPETSEPAKVFAKCCTNRGTCVPLSIAGSIANAAPGDTCPGADSGDPEKCVPTARAQNPDMKFPTCMAAVAPFPPVPGGCVPDCIITDQFQKGFLSQGTCGTGELCAPCVSPLDQMRTGACD
jgi:hypothetical protein